MPRLDERPRQPSGSNLVRQPPIARRYCLNAWLCLAGELASIVDSQSFSIPSDSDTTYTLSLTVDGVGTAQSLRRYAERYVAQSVLASCYAARESLAMQFRDNAARTLSGLRLAATLSDRVDCWL